MSKDNTKWNPPGYPWELELITLCFFVASLFVPYYFHHYGVHESISEMTRNGATALEVGRDSLSTQFGFLLALGIVALYMFHFAFAFMDAGKITTTPLNLLSPCAFAAIAYYRISQTRGLENSALSFIDGSTGQIVLLVIIVGLITSVLARLRTYRYMLNFDSTKWDIITPSPYDGTYFQLIAQMHPLLYAPRRYLASDEGIVIEGWFYAKPISFSRIHSLSRIASSGIMNNGIYFASSSHNLVRLELHESTKATYISPRDRDEFVRYCAQHIARRTPTHHASPTRHGTARASDTHGSGSKGGTAKGTAAGKTNHGAKS